MFFFINTTIWKVKRDFLKEMNFAFFEIVLCFDKNESDSNRSIYFLLKLIKFS